MVSGGRNFRLLRHYAPVFFPLSPARHAHGNQSRRFRAAPDWLYKQWANLFRLRQDGVPIIGFTWYSLTDQVDWDTALREDAGRVNPLGLYDLDRNIRPVGKAYRETDTELARPAPDRKFQPEHAHRTLAHSRQRNEETSECLTLIVVPLHRRLI